jgi:hypothetical protein
MPLKSYNFDRYKEQEVMSVTYITQMLARSCESFDVEISLCAMTTTLSIGQ